MITGLTRPAGALPAEVTSFVGRRHELAEARRLLSMTRLLTLTGPGGVGKTRLALRLADQVRRAFSDGAYLVELGALDDPELLAQTISTSLGVFDTADDALSATADFVMDKQLLIVLDNCEHVIEACAVVSGKLLAAAPELRILATSRHVLGIEGEQILPISPLPIPDPVPSDGREAAAAHDAVSLFAERAVAVLPDFQVDERNFEYVSQICRQLDGIPLAIELAAVRLRNLSLEHIVDRLDDRFRLLVAGSRTAPSRQRTLSAAIGWSYGLCSSDEQKAWTRLAVFAGSFSLAAAEHVVAGGGIETADVLGLLAGLIDKSIVVREVDESGVVARYRMLETIRRYGLERLRSAGQEQACRDRQLDYYLAVARQYASERFSPRQLEWIEQLTAEHANLRVTLDFGLETPGRTEAALEVVTLLWNFWFAGGFLVEGHRWLLRALNANPEPSALRAQGLWSCAFLSLHRGDVESATAMVDECAQFGAEYGDERLAARLVFCRGQLALVRGELNEAAALLEDAVARGGDEHSVADSYILLAAVRFFLDDVAGCAEAAATAHALCTARGARWTGTYAEWALALSMWLRGDPAEGAVVIQRALRERHALRDWTALMYLLEMLSWCTAGIGRYERFAELLGAVLTVRRLSGSREAGAPTYHQIDERIAAQARAALGDDRFNAAYARGRALSVDEIVAMAVEEKPQPRTSRPPDAGAALTPREREIAGLVAEGLTNRQIAARLTISQRTAEGHVEKVLTKLGFTSRAQIAAWIAAQRPHL